MTYTCRFFGCRTDTAEPSAHYPVTRTLVIHGRQPTTATQWGAVYGTIRARLVQEGWTVYGLTVGPAVPGTLYPGDTP